MAEILFFNLMIICLNVAAEDLHLFDQRSITGLNGPAKPKYHTSERKEQEKMQ